MEAKLFSATGDDLGKVELPEKVFSGPVRRHLLFEVVQGYLANRRRGTAKVKTRAEVRGGGRKPWRQKGIGRARHGSIRSPIWVGGGVAHGPRPRSYAVHLNRKAKRLALNSALVAKARDGEVMVLESVSLPEGKTRHVYSLLKKLGVHESRCLLVLDKYDADVLRAARNLPRLRVTTAQWVNAYDVLNCDQVLLTKGALDSMAEARS
jgi:large subunit ribosomal protein L4